MKKLVAIALPFFLLCGHAYSQGFGQNKVQYREFDWQYIQSPHFDIYFYADGQRLAEFTSEVVEEAYDQVSTYLDWELHKRVSIIIYNSHNDFQQTNITTSYMPEGVGGVTELFKNRIAIPFEGSYEQFRHVIHHELVHAMINDMVYGGSAQSIVSNRVQLVLPLWMNEGLAEYLSTQWDTQADMVMRDVAVHDRIPEVPELNYYMAYKGGQSVWKFIVEKYGWQKVGEIFAQAKKRQDVQRAFQKSMGLSFDDLTEQWHKYLKKEYWPDIAGRDEIEDFAQQITDHKELNNFFNISPALSPDGSKIALISDRSGYSDVIIISSRDGEVLNKVVKGNRTPDFEELKLLQPGISWSPEGDRIVLATKAGGSDALFLINAESGKKEKLTFELDGIFTAAWSPDGNRIAFVGNKGEASDIYIYDLDSEKLENLTEDVFSDSEPAWSPDGRRIAFVSDRGENLTMPASFDIHQHQYDQTDLYMLDIESRELKRLTETPQSENFPVFAHTANTLAYTADDAGVWNLHLLDLDSGGSRPVSNVLTGIFQLSWSSDDKKLVFSGYSGVGWDIYSLSNPLTLETKDIRPSNFVKSGTNTDPLQLSLAESDSEIKRVDVEWEDNAFARWIFAPEYTHYNDGIFDSSAVEKIEPLAVSNYKNSDGSYVTQAYKTRFSLDLVSGQAMYSNLWGAMGTTVFAFSDILGDHRIYVGSEMVMNLENSDYFVQYSYLKPRNDLNVGVYHTANVFGSQWNFLRLRYLSMDVSLSRPVSRYQRFGAGLTNHFLNNREYLLVAYNQYSLASDETLRLLTYALNWTYDNSQWGFTSPADGWRATAQFTQSLAMLGYNMDFKTLLFDARRYFRVGRLYTFAFRAIGGMSFGNDPQRFFLGGSQNWLFGTGYTDGERDRARWNDDENADIWDSEGGGNYLKDLYFSIFVLPVRGARLVEKHGTKVLLTNYEFRFPFVNYLALGFPLRVILGNIQGVLFVDAGAAWDDVPQLRYTNPVTGVTNFEDFIATYGAGLRLNIGYTIIRFDAAKDYTMHGSSKWQYYLSLGTDF
ncbi:MAG: hypothetical protein VX822_03545 [Candidatus Neomarinimicrobiota bacterium]|nr:hypothetical protein [Candidatus Neomarinimicrobiota bacterium]